MQYPSFIDQYVGGTSTVNCKLGYELTSGVTQSVLTCKVNSTWHLNTTKCTRMIKAMIYILLKLFNIVTLVTIFYICHTNIFFVMQIT